MYPLPKKLIFGSLTSETIDKRTKEIEEYMATIITDIPQMLRSRYIDEFFGISDRIKTISVQIEEINKKLPKTAPEDEPLYTGMVSLAPGVEEEMGREGNNRKDEMKSEGALAEEEKEVLARLQLEDVSVFLAFLYLTCPLPVSSLLWKTLKVFAMTTHVLLIRMSLGKWKNMFETCDPCSAKPKQRYSFPVLLPPHGPM